VILQPTIHIGYHRTGSTFLQERVFPLLPVNRLIKPELDGLFGSARFDPSELRADLRRQAELDPDRPTVISSELLSGTPEGGPAERRLQTADRLHAAFGSAKILVVIRRQVDYVLSIYAYRVLLRGLDSRSLDRYLADHAPSLLPALQYDTLVQRYIDLFGRDRVLVLPFELLAAESAGFIDAIARFIGVDPPAIPNRRVNESTRNAMVVAINRVLNLPLDRSLGALKRNHTIAHETYLEIARPYFAAKERVINPLLRRLLGSRGGTLRMSTAWADRVAAAVADSNRRLIELTGLDLARHGYSI
jgi:hypothetical protein